jgi:exonuclease SbcD
VIRLAVLLRSRLPICGSRSIVVILEILNECFKGELFDSIPCNQVIEDWCEKAGLDMHTKVKDQFVDNEYITITDESISVGKQKLLLQLAAPADSTGKPLSHSDVSIVGMSVSPSWTGDSVKAEMEKTSKSIGRRPLYSVSDNGYNLCNACRDAGIPHHRDISHTFGTILKKYFSDSPDFKEFTGLMEKKRLAYQLTDKAIVLPPKQRAIARFMNTFVWVKWAHKLLERYDRLTDEQKEAARFMLDNKDLIEEHDLMIPITSRDGKEEAVVLAVPFLRSDVSLDGSYSKGVTSLLHQLTDKAREAYPDLPIIMMAHMYAAGAEIREGSSEKILIGGQEQVSFGKWDNHPDYLTCGHIHKRQHIWNTDWARYTGSVLPMSFAERDYHHGVDLITISQGDKPQVEFIEYEPQHPLVTIPADGEALDLKDMKKAVIQLPDRTGGVLDEHSIYLELRLSSKKIKPDDRKEIEKLLETKNAVLCKLTQVMPDIDVTTSTKDVEFHSIDDILKRNPLDAVDECLVAKTGHSLSEEQRKTLEDYISTSLEKDSNDE